MTDFSNETPVSDQGWTTVDVNLREQDHLFRQIPTHETTLTHNRPINGLDALLRCAPGDTPERTLLEVQELREAVVDAIDRLDDEDRFIIDAIHSERITIQELATRLGLKSRGHVHRMVRKAEAALKAELLKEPLVLERLS